MASVIKGIYSITNLVNNKIYIGRTKNFKKRVYQHLSDLRLNKHHSNHLQFAFNKYGETNFTFKLLREIKEEQNLETFERLYIKLYDSSNGNKGYNFLSEGNKHREESIIQMKIAMEKRKRTLTPEQLELRVKNLRIAIGKRRKPIIEYTKEGIFIKEWDSAVTAGEFYKIQRKHIRGCCRGVINSYYNRIWRDKGDSVTLEDLEKPTRTRKSI